MGDKLKNLIDFAEKLIASEISEEDYINKHEFAQKKENPWHEVKVIAKNKERWSKFISKFRHPGNRRKVLAELTGLTYNELGKIMEWGNSTCGDLIRTSNLKPSTRRIGSEILAQFGIMTRATYQLLTHKKVDLEWDDTHFKLIEQNAIDKEQFLQICNTNVTFERHIKGYVLKVLEKKLYLRVERRRDGFIIIDLANADLELFRILSDALRETSGKWSFLYYPTIYRNKDYFLIFVRNANEDEMNELLREEFSWAEKWYNLPDSSKP
ncbi:hypothetical protein AB6A23_09390 [Paenibacillus tarimensis]